MLDRRQADKLNTGCELIRNRGGYGQSQARFPGTASTSESQKPNVRPEQQRRCFCQLLLSSNKRSTRDWQIVALLGDLCRGQVASIGQIKELSCSEMICGL